MAHKSKLERVVLCSCNNLVLKLLSHIVEIVGISSHTHKQILVAIWLLLSVDEGLCVYDVELNVMPSHAEVGADE